MPFEEYENDLPKLKLSPNVNDSNSFDIDVDTDDKNSFDKDRDQNGRPSTYGDKSDLYKSRGSNVGLYKRREGSF